MSIPSGFSGQRPVALHDFNPENTNEWEQSPSKSGIHDTPQTGPSKQQHPSDLVATSILKYVEQRFLELVEDTAYTVSQFFAPHQK